MKLRRIKKVSYFFKLSFIIVPDILFVIAKFVKIRMLLAVTVAWLLLILLPVHFRWFPRKTLSRLRCFCIPMISFYHFLSNQELVVMVIYEIIDTYISIFMSYMVTSVLVLVLFRLFFCSFISLFDCSFVFILSKF